jgi:hypothetical protein
MKFTFNTSRDVDVALALLLPRDQTIDPELMDISPCVTVCSDQNLSYDRQLSDLALQIDEKIYLENVNIDLVVVVKQNDVKISDKLSLLAHFDEETIYYLDQSYTGSFACSPYVFSVLGGLHKIYFDELGYDSKKFSEIKYQGEKILYLINRMGFKFHVF